MNDRIRDRHARRHVLVRVLDTTMSVVGIVLVFGVIVMAQGRWYTIWVAALGLVLLEAGVWRMSSRVLFTRRYHGLRAEVDEFIRHVRWLNQSAVALASGEDAQEAFDAAAAAMRESVEQMIELAGRSDEEAERAADARTGD